MKEQITRQKHQLKERGICVVIPTYNNCTSIRKTVEETLCYCDDVIVVADGCTDGTTEILETIPHITLVAYQRNRGKGHALREGFRKAMELGFDYAITLDADGQHYPEDIALFLKGNQEHPGCLIVGSRRLEGVERSKGSSFANRFSNFWFWVQTGQALPDTQTGYRLYPLRKLRGLFLLTARYEAELELMVFAAWHGVKLVSIPVRVYYPPRAERVSHFRPVADFARISLLNTVLCFLAVIYGLPLRIFRSFMVVLRTFYSLLFFLFFSSVIFTPLTWLYVKLGKKSEQQNQNLHRLIYHASRFVMIHHGIPGTKLVRNMQEKVDFGKPRIIICNHQSHLDSMCQLIFTPNIVFLTNKWVWNNPFYAVLIRNAEYLPVMDGLDSILPHLKSLVERGYSIAVYPEGTRSRNCKIGRFHQGAFYLAQQLNLEILPMCLYGPGKVLPKGSYYLHKGIIRVDVEKPLSQEYLKSLGGLRQQASYLHQWYVSKYESMANDIERII